MPVATYVFRRPDTPCYFFRWTVPVALRPLLGGRKDIKRSLHTDDKKNAIRLARRLAVTLERGAYSLMAKKDEPPTFADIARLILTANGTLQMEGVTLDPAKVEEELRLVDGLLKITATPPETVAASAPSYTVGQMVKDFFAESDRAKRWTPKSRQEVEANCLLLVEVLGEEAHVAALTRRDFARFKDVLTKIPTNRNKDARYRGKTALELAGMAIPEPDLLNTATINKILTRVSALMKWAHMNGYAPANYAEGMLLPKNKRDDERRDAYKDEEVRALRDAVLKGEHGTADVPWRKWIPLIAMYQGMRLNEIAQLDVADFSEVDGIPVVCINDEGPGKRLKTANSRRTIPVHPALVDAGLLKHVEELKGRGVTRMWPELTLQRDGYGKTPGRWFAKFKKKLAIEHEFHGLRHTTATKLREAEVPPDLIGDILGHSRGEGETLSTYTKNASIQRMHEALKKLSYD